MVVVEFVRPNAPYFVGDRAAFEAEKAERLQRQGFVVPVAPAGAPSADAPPLAETATVRRYPRKG